MKIDKSALGKLGSVVVIYNERGLKFYKGKFAFKMVWGIKKPKGFDVTLKDLNNWIKETWNVSGFGEYLTDADWAKAKELKALSGKDFDIFEIDLS